MNNLQGDVAETIETEEKIIPAEPEHGVHWLKLKKEGIIDVKTPMLSAAITRDFLEIDSKEMGALVGSGELSWYVKSSVKEGQAIKTSSITRYLNRCKDITDEETYESLEMIPKSLSKKVEEHFDNALPKFKERGMQRRFEIKKHMDGECLLDYIACLKVEGFDGETLVRLILPYVFDVRSETTLNFEQRFYETLDNFLEKIENNPFPGYPVDFTPYKALNRLRLYLQRIPTLGLPSED